jgi:hypothetical protein
MKKLFLALLALTLAACHSAASRDVNSPSFTIPRGSSLTLHKELPIPERQRHVKLQHGKPVSGVDGFKANCQMRVYDLGVEAIRPDRFQIARTGEGREWESRPYVLRFFRVLHLESETQPWVIKLICQRLDDPGWGRNVSVPEMREAVGDYITFEFPAEPAR